MADMQIANVTQLDGTAQRATDLAEIAQYLIANSAEPLATYLADDSIIAKLLAADGDISEYNDQNHSLEALRVQGDSAWATATGFALASLWTEARAGALTDWIDGGRLDLLLDAIPTTAMRGTDSAALASLWTEARAGALTDWIDGGRLDLLLDAIPTTAMRGTDSAALATTALSTAVWTAALAQVLTDWINGGRLDLLLDAIPTTAMRGTDSAALASVATEARLAELDAAKIPSDVDDLATAVAAVPTANENADAYLGRGVDNVEDTADEHSVAALILAAFESELDGTTWTIRKTDGTTFVTKTVAVDEDADPVVSVT